METEIKALNEAAEKIEKRDKSIISLLFNKGFLSEEMKENNLYSLHYYTYTRLDRGHLRYTYLCYIIDYIIKVDVFYTDNQWFALIQSFDRNGVPIDDCTELEKLEDFE